MSPQDPQPSGGEDALRNQGQETRKMPPPPPPPSTSQQTPGGLPPAPQPVHSAPTQPLSYAPPPNMPPAQSGMPPAPQSRAQVQAAAQSGYAPAPHGQVGHTPGSQPAGAHMPQGAPQPVQPYQPYGHPGGAQQHPGMPSGQQQAPYPGAYGQGEYPQPTPVTVAVVEEIEVVPVDHVSITTGFNYAWMKFRQHMGVLVLAALAYMGILAAIVLVVFALSGVAGRQNSMPLFFLIFLIGTAAAIMYPAFAQAN